MTQTLTQPDLAFVDDAIAKIGGKPEHLIALLQSIQEHYHYLPAEALERIAGKTQIQPSAITGVASFFAQFRHKPAGRHIIHVCHGTACHVKGSELVHDAIRRYLHLEGEADTDAAGEFTVERVGCVGCCTLAPVVQVDTLTLGHVPPADVPHLLEDAVHTLSSTTEDASANEANGRASAAAEIRIGVGSCCIAGGSQEVRHALEKTVKAIGADAIVKPVGCVGMCHQTPIVEIVRQPNSPEHGTTLYTKVTSDQADQIVRRHFRSRGPVRRLYDKVDRAINRLLTDESDSSRKQLTSYVEEPICSFLSHQVRLATEFCGRLDPLDVEEYRAHHGFQVYDKVIHEWGCSAEKILQAIEASGLRGRGGAGFPTARKWRLVAAAKSDQKYVICNGDEGDPGAFMDRMILESYPYRVIEGMLVAGCAVGASKGRFYIRHEYPLAVERIRSAILAMYAGGMLGANIGGTGFSFDVDVVEGAGAFVCGEETALIASVEGRRGMPQLRPPYPAESGLWDKPTLINNVETLALVPWIIRHGGEQFAKLGTAASKGTKVFALTGKILRGGLIEVPMGVTIRHIVERIGGGVEPGRQFKAVQIGGPSGGCIPASLADTSVDYESLQSIGAIMGSGGLVVLDDRDCMVDIARYFLQFTQAESCGKCTFCRVGTRRMLEILNRFCEGKAVPADLQKLEELAHQVKSSSLCGLGQTAPNPVLTTLRYFREEYEAHLKGICPAGKCRSLVHYTVQDNCIGCTICSQQCPVGAIPFVPYQKHTIDQAICTRCDVCRTACPEQAITVI